MGDKEDYLTSYRMFFEYFAATVDPEDQLPVQIAGYTITESELPGEVLHWLTQYFSQKQCPATLLTTLRHIILDDVRIASKKSPQEFGYKPDEAVYEALRLMQAVTSRANAICLRYLDNSKLDTLPAPPTPTHTQLKTVSCAEKNSRRMMEDRHVQIGNLEEMFGVETTEPTSFYAVYDGHAGSAAAIYCAVHLHQYLLESPHFTTDLQRAMRDAFLRTDAEFVRKSNQGVACGGSTAVAVCVRGRRLLAAWAGDSLALLAKRMRLMQLVCAHKPHREDEKERIESSGGTVMYWGTWRVNGQLAVSRAIGDAQYKPYVTARPEIAIVDLDGDEDFVVIACDGLWDFVSEDEVALTVYGTIAANPDDVNAVTKRLTEQAKRQGSTDNISIIVVFLKDPHAIASDNGPPMDIGLDNALANGPPFPADNDACKRLPETAVAGAVVVDSCDNDNSHDNGIGNGVDNGLGNGLDNSDSDDDDLGPETAVDADDVDAEARELEQSAATPPVQNHDEPSHLEAPADNVAESGDDSDDEWNYFRGEGEPRADAAEDNEQDLDLPTSLQRSPTPCQDNSAWESSSVDMNSSPLNPDAPVFVPGTVAGSDVLLAGSPRKPLPMDDIELPDVAQFETGAVIRPAELLDLDNCNQLNGHHNISLEEKENLNGNDKCSMDSLGFGFNVGVDKETALLQDFDRIQKDTTDFCNIQVFQTTLETNPFASDGNDELFERLKNKERDPMSMSFYQEKDDDTCERFTKPEPQVDLNAVQPLPESDDEDLSLNGLNSNEDNKENICTDNNSDILGVEKIHEPDNDILRFEERTENVDNYTDFSQLNNLADFTSSDTSNVQTSEQELESQNTQEVVQTDTPESHKLLFEQIPEIPDGKSSELGFTNEDHQLEGEKEVRAITPLITNETSQQIHAGQLVELNDVVDLQDENLIETQETDDTQLEPVTSENIIRDQLISPEISNDVLVSTPSPAPAAETCADVHHEPPRDEFENDVNLKERLDQDEKEFILDAPDIRLEAAEPELERLVNDSPLPTESSMLVGSPVPAASPKPAESPRPSEASLPTQSPLPSESPMPGQSPLPVDSPLPAQTPLPAESVPAQSLLPVEPPSPAQSPLATESPLPVETAIQSPLPTKSPEPTTTPLPANSPIPLEISKSPQPVESPTPLEAVAIAPVESQPPRESQSLVEVAAPADIPLPRESPVRSPTPLAEEAHERCSAPAEPADLPAQPDVVPEAPRSDLVTDIDIGIPESRAQEICVPVTSELADHVPPPAQPPLSDAPIAAAAVTAAAASAVAAVVTAAKPKTTAKKSPTTPNAKPLSAAKKPLTPTPARTPAAKTSSASKLTATKTTTPAAKSPMPATKIAAAAKPAPARTSKIGAKPAATATTTDARPTSAAARTSTAKTTAATKPAPAKEPVAAAKSSTVSRTAPRPAAPRSAPAPRPAPASAAARPAPRAAPAAPRAAAAAPRAAPAVPRTAPVAPRPAPRAAPPKPKEPVAPKPKPIEKKPLTNGDVKPPAAKPAPKPNTRPALATKTTAARPLDKQSKDLANKRITAKAAPPRTASAKSAAAAPPPATKPPPIRKPTRAAPPADKLPDKSADIQPDKLADAAALPDVIA